MTGGYTVWLEHETTPHVATNGRMSLLVKQGYYDKLMRPLVGMVSSAGGCQIVGPQSEALVTPSILTTSKLYECVYRRT